MKYLLFLASIFLTSSLADSVRAEDTGAERLAKLLFIHSVEMEEAEKPLREKVAELNTNYVKALERVAGKSQSAGNLEELLAIRGEIEHVEKNGTLGTKPYPGHVGMRQKYGDALIVLAKENSGEMALAAAQHAKELEELKVELTKDGELETAMKVSEILGDSTGIMEKVTTPSPTQPAATDFATNQVKDSPIFANEAFHGEMNFERGIYEIKSQIRLGSDKPEKREDRFGHAVAPAGTVFRGGEFFIDNGSLDATACLFDGVDLNVDLHGEVTARDCVFDGGRLRKGGAWSVKWFSAKWTFDNCVFNGVFVSPMRVRSNGLKMTNCTVIGAEIDPGEYYEEPVEEADHEWRQVERCHFIGCKVPETFLLMTEDCVFEDCTFVANIAEVNPERSKSVTLYFVGSLPPLLEGDNKVTFKSEDVIGLKKDYGSTVKYDF